MTTNTGREQERQGILRQYPLTYPFILIGVGLLIGIVLGFRLFASPDSTYGVNLYTTLIDIGVTVGVIEILSRRRDAQRADRERLQALVTQMGSKDNVMAVAAMEILRLRGWLHDGSMQSTELQGANLEGAHLDGAHLTGANLIGAYLTGAHLAGAHLEGARLGSAHMQAANLSGAHLERARLIGAQLEGADLGGAHLEGANLGGAHLERANLGGVHFDVHTTLPDNTLWTPDTNMARFTDPDHPHFGHADS